MYYLVDFCCICFNKEHLQHLHASDIDNITYFTKLTACVPEMCFNEMKDQRLVCITCCETLVAAYKFRQRCLRSKTTLTDYISQLHQVSDISGIVNVYLTDISKFNDIKKEYLVENNLEIKKEKTKLCNDMDEETDDKENFEISFETEINSDNPISLKLTDNRPNYIQVGHVIIKMEPKHTKSVEHLEENYDSSSEDEINIDASNNDFNTMAPETKRVNKDQEEHLQESTNNILETYGENVDIGTKIEKNHAYSSESEICSDELVNLVEIKIEIVDNDLELMTGEINTQYKSENVDESSKDVIPLKLQGEAKTYKGEKPHECNVCNKKFRDSSCLKRHMRIHTGEKPHECDVCKKTFRTLSHIIQHRRIHTGEKPYECSVCNKKFRISCDRNRHMRTHTEKKPHECSVCKKTFSQLSNKISHMRSHFREKPHKCSVCKKTFSQLCNKIIHMRTHTREKPYECNVCNKKFSQSGALTIHKRIHTGEKPYECSVCDKKFSSLSSQLRHSRIHIDRKLPNAVSTTKI